MSQRSNTSRRTLLRLAAASAALPFLPGRAIADAAGGEAPADPARRVRPLKIGVASYSLRKLPLDRVIQVCQEAQVQYVAFKDVHLPRTDPPETTRALRQKVEAAGLTIMGGGTITWNKNDEALIRKDFEYAKNAGLPLMVVSPAPETLDTVEKLVKEYNIKTAIHNHGPEDKWYPAPKDALAKLDGRDPRMGICMDIGHAIRAGADIVQSVTLAGARLLDLHVKDLADKEKKDSQVEVGKGVIDIPGLFRALVKARFAGHVSLEYEINENDPVTGLKESLGYMKGVTDAVGQT
jgi:sugar phosphate isomerase/epimerase